MNLDDRYDAFWTNLAFYTQHCLVLWCAGSDTTILRRMGVSCLLALYIFTTLSIPICFYLLVEFAWPYSRWMDGQAWREEIVGGFALTAP